MRQTKLHEQPMRTATSCRTVMGRLLLMTLLMFTFLGARAQVQIGTGEATNSYLPSYSYYNYSVSQQIYTADEIAASGNITSIAFYNGGSAKARKFNIYLAHTTKTAFDGASDWIELTDADLVYEGTEAVTMTVGAWTTFTLDTPFAYNGTDNLVVGVLDLTGSWESGMDCRVFDATGDQALYKYQDDGAYGIDGTYNGSVVAGTLLAKKNQIILGGIQQAYPTPLDLVCTGVTANSATLSWTEIGTATSWQICLNDDETNLITAATNPFTLTGLTAEQTYTAKVRGCYDGNHYSSWSDASSFIPTTKIVIGSGTATNSYLPTYIYYLNSLTQQIYTAAELGEGGIITSIDFYCTANNTYARDFDIYMVSTSKDRFESTTDWINVTSADLVYSGSVTLTEGWNTFEIDGFVYDGTSNVAIIVDAHAENYQNNIGFYVYNAPSENQTLRIYSDGTDYDPFSPSSYTGTLMSVKNQLRLVKEPLLPCTKPTNLVVTDVTAHTATLSWTSEADAWKLCINGDEANPIDVTTNPYTLTGLNAETNYSVKLRSNCGAEDGMSIWTGEVSFTTEVSCPTPTITSITADNYTATIITDSEADNFNVRYRQEGETTWQTTNSLTLTGLNPETTYEVQVQANCGAEDGMSEWSDIMTFTTDVACPAPSSVVASNLTQNSADISWNGNAESYTVQYRPATVSGSTQTELFTEGFENDLAGWTTFALGYSSDLTNWQTYDATNLGSDYNNTNHGGSYVARSKSYAGSSVGDVTVDNWLISPQMTIGDGMTLWVSDDGNWHEHIEVRVCTAPTFSESTLTTDFALVDVLADAEKAWTQRTVDLSAYAGQTGYIAIRNNDTGKDFICIDDIVVYQTVNSYSYGTESTLTTTENSCQLTGLTAETLYEVQVQADYGSEGTSLWSTIYFTTPDACGAPTDLVSSNVTSTTATLGWANTQESYNLRYRKVYFYEDFESETLPTGWTTIDANNDGNTWGIGFATAHGGHNGAYNLSYIYNTTGTTPNDYLVSPQLDLQGTLRVWLSGYGTERYDEHFAIYVSTNGNSASDFTTTLVGETTTTNGYVEYTADLSSYAGQKGYIAIRHFNCTDQYYLYVDDFGLYGSEDWITATSDEATMSLDNLTPAIGYEWQVQGVNCSGEGSTTEWSEVATFNTLVSLELADDDSEKPEGEKNSDLIGANANKKADVSISDRTLWKDECWNTLCLPFSMTAEQVTAQLAPDELKELDTTTPNEGHVTGVEGSTLYLNFKDSENGIVAGVPYLIKWTKPDPYVPYDGTNAETTSDIVNPVFSSVEIVNGAPTVVESTDHKVIFKGNYTPVSFSTETPSILFVGGNNTLYYPQPANAGQPVVIGAFRAYFQLEDPTAVRSFSLNFGDNSKSNGIMTMSYTKKAEGWYTLDGRKLLNAPKRKGLYIHNGVKVTIK